MNLTHIVALAVRLFAIVLALYAIRNGVAYTAMFIGQEQQSASLVFGSLMAFFLMLSIVLWRFPLTIAKGLMKFGESDDGDIVTVPTHQIQIVGFNILGMYLLFYVVSDVFYWVVIFFASQRNHSLAELSIDQIASMVTTAIELVFVILLLLGARGLSRTLHRIRYGNGG